MAPPPLTDEDATHHSHLHYVMGTTITVADVATFGTALYILSMSLQLFLTWKLADFKIQEQAGILLLIAVCIYVASRLIIWLLCLLHKAVTRWEELAATMREEDVHWLRRYLLKGVLWAQRIPADLPKVSDFYIDAPRHPVELESITVNLNAEFEGDDDDNHSVSVAPPMPKQREEEGKKSTSSSSSSAKQGKSRPRY